MNDVSASSKIAGLAAEERLGALIRAQGARKVDRRARNWLVMFGLPGLMLLPFTVHFLWNGFGWATILSLFLTVLYLGAAGVILVRDVLPVYGRALYLYEHGLVLAGRGTATAFPWDSIRELRVSGVRMGDSDRVSWRFEVIREDRVEGEVGAEFTDVQAVVEAVSAAVTERVLPKYISRVEAGRHLRIGPFTVTAEAIEKDGERVPWQHVVGVEISNGMVQVDRSDGLAGLSSTAGEVPNAVAFSELVRHIRQVRHSPGMGDPGMGEEPFPVS